jgi:hypothetical protein
MEGILDHFKRRPSRAGVDVILAFSSRTDRHAKA